MTHGRPPTYEAFLAGGLGFRTEEWSQTCAAQAVLPCRLGRG